MARVESFTEIDAGEDGEDVGWSTATKSSSAVSATIMASGSTAPSTPRSPIAPSMVTNPANTCLTRAVKALKKAASRGLLVGSPTLSATLQRLDLVDEISLRGPPRGCRTRSVLVFRPSANIAPEVRGRDTAQIAESWRCNTCVRRRRSSSRIVARIAFSAEALTAGLNPQNSALSRERLTRRGRKQYPRKSNCTFGYVPFRCSSLQ